MTRFLRHSGSCVTPTHLMVRRVGWHGVLWIWQGQLAQQLKAALEEMVKDGQYLMKLERANIFNLDDTKAQEQLDERDELMLERTREVHVKEKVAETERETSRSDAGFETNCTAATIPTFKRQTSCALRQCNASP